VATVQRTCPGKGGRKCGTRFRVPSQSRRMFCEACSPPRFRHADGPPPAPPVDEGPGPIEVAVLAELERTGRAGTIEGVALATLARDADRLPPDKRAAVVERLLRVKALALVGAKPPSASPVDEIGRRRAERIASAS